MQRSDGVQAGSISTFPAVTFGGGQGLRPVFLSARLVPDCVLVGGVVMFVIGLGWSAVYECNDEVWNTVDSQFANDPVVCSDLAFAGDHD